MTSDGVLLNGFAPNGVAGTNNMSSAASNLGIHWNPKNLEIKTRSVEKTLEPLVMQASDKPSSSNPQGVPKSAKSC